MKKNSLVRGIIVVLIPVVLLNGTYQIYKLLAGRLEWDMLALFVVVNTMVLTSTIDSVQTIRKRKGYPENKSLKYVARISLGINIAALVFVAGMLIIGRLS